MQVLSLYRFDLLFQYGRIKNLPEHQRLKQTEKISTAMDTIITIICFCHISFKILSKHKRISFFKLGLSTLFRVSSNYNNETSFSLRWMLEFLVIHLRTPLRHWSMHPSYTSCVLVLVLHWMRRKRRQHISWTPGLSVPAVNKLRKRSSTLRTSTIKREITCILPDSEESVSLNMNKKSTIH